MTKAVTSADGYPIEVGDVVWTKKSTGWEWHIVKENHLFKVTYEEPDSEGYIGGNLSIVYKYNPEMERR